jgi:hypothetical protein
VCISRGWRPKEIRCRACPRRRRRPTRRLGRRATSRQRPSPGQGRKISQSHGGGVKAIRRFRRMARRTLPHDRAPWLRERRRRARAAGPCCWPTWRQEGSGRAGRAFGWRSGQPQAATASRPARAWVRFCTEPTLSPGDEGQCGFVFVWR